MKAELEWLRQLKEKLCEERIKLSKLTKSDPWNIEDLRKVLKSLKRNKCRDAHGMINELFKPGEDLKLAILKLMKYF